MLTTEDSKVNGKEEKVTKQFAVTYASMEFFSTVIKEKEENRVY